MFKLAHRYKKAEDETRLHGFSTQAMPTERPPFVGEVRTNFCGESVSRGRCNGSARRLISTS
jgi:hypothetical protein